MTINLVQQLEEAVRAEQEARRLADWKPAGPVKESALRAAIRARAHANELKQQIERN